MYIDSKYSKFKDIIYLASDNLEDGIVLVHENGEVVFYNDAIAKFFGPRMSSFSEPIGDKLAWTIYGEDGATVLEKNELPVKQALEGNKVNNIQIFSKHIDNSNGFWLLVSGGPIEIDDFKGAILVYRDKTELKIKELEQQLISERLKQSNEAKDALFKMLAHDLLNPINAISGLSSLVLEDSDDEETKEVAKIILECSETLKKMTHETLETALSKASDKLEFKKLNLKDVVEDSLSLSKIIADKKEVKLSSWLSETGLVQGDQRALKRTFENLITNAIKFSSMGQTIEVSLYEKDRSICFEVKDHGLGMNEDHLSNLFKGRRENCRMGTDGERSTGLGLPFVKEVVDAHSGRIEVNSKEGEGTTFQVYIPLS